jgi:hypothetical protein
MLQKECFAASTLLVTHQQAQFNKMKSKQHIKNQNTNHRQQTHPPPAPESMQPASIASRKTSFPAGKNQHRRQLFSFPKHSIIGWKKKNRKKKLQNIKNQQNQEKQNPNSKSFLAK